MSIFSLFGGNFALQCKLFCGKEIEIGCSIPVRDEPVPMTDIIDSFPAVLRVIESMREENEQRKLQKVNLDQKPRLIEGLETNFKTFESQEDEKPSLIQKVIFHIISYASII